MNIQTVVINYLNKIFPVAPQGGVAPKAIKASDDAEIAIAIACATFKTKSWLNNNFNKICKKMPPMASF